MSEQPVKRYDEETHQWVTEPPAKKTAKQKPAPKE